MPMISVITPAYNAGSTISETIASVRAQTFTDWEMLVVDDGSVDNTASIVKSFASQDHRIRLIQLPSSHQPKTLETAFFGLLPKARTRSSAASPRNAALKVARGRFIAFIDADDLWLPPKLERQLAFMLDCGAFMTYCQYRRFTSDPTRAGPIVTLPPSFTYQSLRRNTGIGGPLTVMLDTWQSGPFEFPDFPHEDLCLWLQLLRSGRIAQGLQEDLCRYRVSSTSISGNKLRSAIETWLVLRRAESLPLPVAGRVFLEYAWRSVLRRVFS